MKQQNDPLNLHSITIRALYHYVHHVVYIVQIQTDDVFIGFWKKVKARYSDDDSVASTTTILSHFCCTSASRTEVATRLMLRVSLVVMLCALRSYHVGVGGNRHRDSNSEYNYLTRFATSRIRCSQCN